MDELVINGGTPLHGTVRVRGAKNAALPLMAATILTDGVTTLHQVPHLRDVETMADILRLLGVAVEWAGARSLRLVPYARDAVVAPSGLVRRMRGSICVLGPLLARRGAALLPQPGGCVLGDRPIDLHLSGMRALGAEVDETDSCIEASATRLRGARLSMAGPHGSSVLGTANALMAAALAEGRTVIAHAAREPEVQDLARFLNACGARIRGIGTPTLTVQGVDRLRGVEYTLIPDRIEAATFLTAAALTGGRVTVEGVRPDHMKTVVDFMQRLGIRFFHQPDGLTVAREDRLWPADLETAPYPGLPTDTQPQLSALLCLARGRSRVHERIYPDRFTHLAALRQMGARIRREGACAEIEGVRRLEAAAVHVPDIRAGGALVAAALAAAGTTTITGTEHIDRGYEALEERLRALGASILRRSAEPARRQVRKSA
ncbi:MAG: UDP-N-acetylglucosamine 1-carboxyvinyltransferase [Planctomycetota bacterium]|jgi:UDP-N-acetylglucosamine 1-carboxyvinyltransferase